MIKRIEKELFQMRKAARKFQRATSDKLVLENKIMNCEYVSPKHKGGK